MRRAAILISLAALLAVTGCVPTHLRETVRVRADDWTMEGGGPGRTNVARATLSPPLVLRWEYDAGAGFGPGPALGADSFLFVGNLRGEVHAVRIRDGSVTGIHDFGAAVAGSPVLGKRLLYVALAREEKTVIGYDLDDGRVVWEYAAGDVIASPLLDGDRLVVASLGGTVTCLDAVTGEKRWTYESSAPGARRSVAVRAAPASDGERVFVGRDDGSLLALGLADGRYRWSARSGGAINAAPVAGDGRVVAASLDGTLRAYDAASGALLWARPLGSRLFGAPALARDAVYCGTSAGALVALSVADGSERWRAAFQGGVNSAPLVAGSIVYAASLDRSVAAFDAATGERLWRAETKGRVKSSPMIAEGLLVVLAEDRAVLAYGPGGAP